MHFFAILTFIENVGFAKMVISLQEARQFKVKWEAELEDYERELQACIKSKNCPEEQVARYQAIKEKVLHSITLMDRGIAYRYRLSSGITDQSLIAECQNAIDAEPTDLWTLTFPVD
jgi:hypothetical protein